MPFEVITLGFDSANGCFHAEDLNCFCLNKRIKFQRVEFFADGESAYWTVFLEYDVVLGPTGDETDHLTEAGKLCYDRLREWRKERASNEGIPPYVIAKNKELLLIVEKEMTSIEALKQIHGFGAKKIEKYGKEISELMRSFFNND